MDTTAGQPRIHGKRHVGRAHQFFDNQPEGGWQPLATVLDRAHETSPAAVDVTTIGRTEAGRRGDHTIGELAAFHVAASIAGLDFAFSKPVRFFQQSIDERPIQRIILRERAEVSCNIQNIVNEELHVLE